MLQEGPFGVSDLAWGLGPPRVGGCADDGRPTWRGLPARLGLSYLTVTLG